jgi:hypothetical protein
MTSTHSRESLRLHLLAALIVIGVPYLALSWLLGGFSGTSVSFQSSDGHWADSEVLFKGRDYSAVRSYFEEYRAECAPEVVLQRTTPHPPWYSIEHWFNNYAEAKWSVPYSPRIPYSRPNCFPGIKPARPNNSFKPNPLRGSA